MKDLRFKINTNIIEDWKSWRIRSCDYCGIGKPKDAFVTPEEESKHLDYVARTQATENDIYEKKNDQAIQAYKDFLSSKQFKFRMIPKILTALFGVAFIVIFFAFVVILFVEQKLIPSLYLTSVGTGLLYFIFDKYNDHFNKKNTELSEQMTDAATLFGLSTLYGDLITHRKAYLTLLIEKEAREKEKENIANENETIHQSADEGKNRRSNSKGKKQSNSRS